MWKIPVCGSPSSESHLERLHKSAVPSAKIATAQYSNVAEAGTERWLGRLFLSLFGGQNSANIIGVRLQAGRQAALEIHKQKRRTANAGTSRKLRSAALQWP